MINLATASQLSNLNDFFINSKRILLMRNCHDRYSFLFFLSISISNGYFFKGYLSKYRLYCFQPCLPLKQIDQISWALSISWEIFACQPEELLCGKFTLTQENNQRTFETSFNLPFISITEYSSKVESSAVWQNFRDSLLCRRWG